MDLNSESPLCFGLQCFRSNRDFVFLSTLGRMSGFLYLVVLMSPWLDSGREVAGRGVVGDFAGTLCFLCNFEKGGN